jgi:hypothetical protein
LPLGWTDTIMWITWNQQDSAQSWPPVLEEKVELFYQRALGWQLHIADILSNGGQPLGKSFSVPPIPHSGFAVLQICLSYFETIGQYEQTGPTRKNSAKFFKAGVKSIFPQLTAEYGRELDRLLTRLYEGARCGLYHSSMATPGVGLGQPSDGTPIAFDPSTNLLAISPERLTTALKHHLEQFRIRVLDPANKDLRHSFEIRFNEHHGIV